MQEQEPDDIEAWNKAARNNPRIVFEHQIDRLEGLSSYEHHFIFRKSSDGAYKDKITQIRWDSWKQAWEAATQAERERCANIAESLGLINVVNASIVCRLVALEIRDVK